ncbi:phosphogluconate dehydratase [Anopheles sinensis]|uniref:Phosphogluconate dehydratase n=1 Tax=Anopheles sinensis TaxID=74873 RepID=A0A084VFQ0_ANOSI|nr:phosphogluconate dehydratase [Anopheles sinensis]
MCCNQKLHWEHILSTSHSTPEWWCEYVLGKAGRDWDVKNSNGNRGLTGKVETIVVSARRPQIIPIASANRTTLGKEFSGAREEKPPPATQKHQSNNLFGPEKRPPETGRLNG